MFTKQNVSYYIFAFALIMVSSYVGNQFRQKFTEYDTKDDYELVKKYLLNDSPLYGYNKPKIWIHSKYEINARFWKNFQSRNTTDLNQPYLYLTIQTIINHCGDDFHICLIDDETFTKLIPTWDIDLTNTVEPMKSHYRDIGMLELVYYYGGMVLPNSFLCTRNLFDLYSDGTINKKPFVTEEINRTMNLKKETVRRPFIPGISIMGAIKNDSTIKECIEYLKRFSQNGHFSNEMDFTGEISFWCLEKIKQDKMNLIDGSQIGIKTKQNKPILLDDLMEEEFLDIDLKKIHGILIPRDELLRRPKYQWFSILPYAEVLKTTSILSKYFKSSMVDSVNEYQKKNGITGESRTSSNITTI
jgi:hypothetical protein